MRTDATLQLTKAIQTNAIIERIKNEIIDELFETNIMDNICTRNVGLVQKVIILSRVHRREMCFEKYLARFVKQYGNENVTPILYI